VVKFTENLEKLFYCHAPTCLPRQENIKLSLLPPPPPPPPLRLLLLLLLLLLPLPALACVGRKQFGRPCALHQEHGQSW